MDYQRELISDFAQRTRHNLRFIEEKEQEGECVYEVTQLVNSMLGLLVFPRERWGDRIWNEPLDTLAEKGWPRINIVEGKLRKDNLKELTRMLRNGIAHCNIEFLADNNRQITGLMIWNRCNCGKLTWKAKLTLDDLRQLTEKFVDMITTPAEGKGDAGRPYREGL